jgi:tetratricopeptide (TPR) repeat protein
MVPSPASAEESSEAELDRARRLFTEGLGLSDRGNWAAAAERFQEALIIHEAPAITFNLAVAYVRLGRPAEAAELLDLTLAAPEIPEQVRADAEQVLGEIEPGLGSILIFDEADREVAVTLDGRPVPADRLDGRHRVEPGNHLVVAIAEGEEILRRDVDVGAGETAEVRLPSPTLEGAVEEAIEEATDEVDEERPLVRDWRLWIGVGAGVVVLVTAIAVGVAVSGQVEDPIFGTMDPGVITWR